jgi:EAL domain-containing protein (putative c-di-GMP-specific phosphodiesterase class I)
VPPLTAGEVAGFDGTFAFQPVVDTATRRVFSYEALLRGPGNESPGAMLGRVRARAGDIHRYDREGRLKAIELAGRLGATTFVNLNCLPLSLGDAEEGIAAIRRACERSGLPANRLILEVTEEEVIEDRRHFARLLDRYRGAGLRIAIDDFGAGYSGLNLLADYQPDYLKIDMHLAQGIEADGPRQAIARAIVQACTDLGIEVVAEGIETPGELAWFEAQGVHLFQGYLFARPAFEALPVPNFGG